MALKTLFCAVFILLVYSTTNAGDEFGGAWHNPEEYDSMAGENVHVKSEFTSSESQGKSGTTTTIQERTEVTGEKETKLNVLEKETHHPDGSVDSRTEIAHTGKYGDQTVEISSKHYDKNGNLTSETYSGSKGAAEQPHAIDDGLRYEGTKDQGTVEQANSTITVGSDKIKIENAGVNLDKILDLRTGQTYYVNHKDKEYRTANIGICLELAPVSQDVVRVGLPAMEVTLQQMASNPMMTGDAKQKLKEALEKIKQLKNYEPPKTEELTYERTRKYGLFAGQVGEQVLVKDKEGKLFQEFWVAKGVSAVAIMRPKTFSQKTKETFVSKAKLTPEIRRLFNGLVLKSAIHYPWGQGNAFQVKKIERVKVSPSDFLPPEGYAKAGRYEAKEIEPIMRKVLELEKLMQQTKP